MVFLGKVLKFRGNKGEVIIDPSPAMREVNESEFPCTFLESPKRRLPAAIQAIREIGGQTVVKFAGIDSIADALGIVGYRLVIESGRVLAPQEESLSSIVGFRVLDMEGGCWGTIENVRDDIRNPLLEVRSESGDEIIFVPGCEPILHRIDFKARLVWIDPPHGLRELNR